MGMFGLLNHWYMVMAGNITDRETIRETAQQLHAITATKRRGKPAILEGPDKYPAALQCKKKKTVFVIAFIECVDGKPKSCMFEESNATATFG